MIMENIEALILKTLKEIQPDYDFEDGVDFVEAGYLDSFDVVSLVSELEQASLLAAAETVSDFFIPPKRGNSEQGVFPFPAGRYPLWETTHADRTGNGCRETERCVQ